MSTSWHAPQWHTMNPLRLTLHGTGVTMELHSARRLSRGGRQRNQGQLVQVRVEAGQKPAERRGLGHKPDPEAGFVHRRLQHLCVGHAHAIRLSQSCETGRGSGVLGVEEKKMLARAVSLPSQGTREACERKGIHPQKGHGWSDLHDQVLHAKGRTPDRPRGNRTTARKDGRFQPVWAVASELQVEAYNALCLEHGQQLLCGVCGGGSRSHGLVCGPV